MQHRLLEVRQILHAPDHDVDLAVHPGELEHAIAQLLACGRDAADRAAGLEHLGEEGDLQEARHEDRHLHRLAHRILVLDEEAAVAGDAAHAELLELPRRLDDRCRAGRVAGEHPIERQALHRLEQDGIAVARGIADVARNEGGAIVQQENADRMAVCVGVTGAIFRHDIPSFSFGRPSNSGMSSQLCQAR